MILLWYWHEDDVNGVMLSMINCYYDNDNYWWWGGVKTGLCWHGIVFFNFFLYKFFYILIGVMKNTLGVFWVFFFVAYFITSLTFVYRLELMKWPNQMVGSMLFGLVSYRQCWYQLDAIKYWIIALKNICKHKLGFILA